MSSPVNLSQLKPNQSAVIKRVDCSSALRSRLTALGMFPGSHVMALFKSMSGDPAAYFVQNCVIALRKSDAEKIYIY